MTATGLFFVVVDIEFFKTGRNIREDFKLKSRQRPLKLWLPSAGVRMAAAAAAPSWTSASSSSGAFP